MKSLGFSIAALLAAQTIPAAAGGVNDDVRLCRAALRAHPEASQHRARFERITGGRVRVLRFSITPKDGPKRRAYCKIERGVVTAIELAPGTPRE